MYGKDIESEIERLNTAIKRCVYPPEIKKMRKRRHRLIKLKRIRDKYYEKLDRATIYNEMDKINFFTKKIREIDQTVYNILNPNWFNTSTILKSMK